MFAFTFHKEGTSEDGTSKSKRQNFLIEESKEQTPRNFNILSEIGSSARRPISQVMQQRQQQDGESFCDYSGFTGGKKLV